MHTKGLKFLALFLSTTFCFSVNAQQKFSVNIKFLKGFNFKNAEISYHNGVEEKKIKVLRNQTSFKLSDSFFSKYATIIVSFDSSSYKIPSFNSFYVTDVPSTIVFHKKKVEIKNGLSVNSIKQDYESYIFDENNQIEDFVKKSNLKTPDSFQIINEKLRINLINKQLEYIKQNKTSYYAFNLFKLYIAPSFFMNPDSLLRFYKSIFPLNFLNTNEGSEIENILSGRIVAEQENIQALDFTSIDILGNKINLQNYKGKFLLVNLWASWCKPCVAELPAIKEIKDKYSSDKLDVISISFDRDSTKFLTALKKYNMSWTNIYRDYKLANKFGGAGRLPMLFLIDKNGTIIYNRLFRGEISSQLPILKSIVAEKI